jgi:hypothetical protein
MKIKPQIWGFRDFTLFYFIEKFNHESLDKKNHGLNQCTAIY